MSPKCKIPSALDLTHENMTIERLFMCVCRRRRRRRRRRLYVYSITRLKVNESSCSKLL